MKLLVSWLRELADVRLPVANLASLLSMRGFEVAGIETVEGRADDAVIDFEITANRPDCLSVAGLAREAATACRVPLRLPWDEAGRPISTARPVPCPTSSRRAADGLEVAIEDADLCPRYAAAVADVRIGPSPGWLADRLTATGVRPINNIVDVTNYVLLEMGHPMHAFDLERLAGRQLRARRARAGERLRTLDGEDRALEPGTLVIADSAVPQAVAGVMGGAAGEVWSGTRLVAFESAYFNPASVRRTSKRLGLKTEASSRFERGTDINAPVIALKRACGLMEQIGAGRRVGAVIDVYPAPRGPIEVTLRRERIPRLLGTAVDDAEVVRILTGLGFGVADTPGGWRVQVPTVRVDILREVDLIEEVARHHGYDRVPYHFPPLRAVPPRPEPGMARKNLLRRVLTAAGFSEAVTYTFIDAADAEPFADGNEPSVPLAYPLSEKFAVLRPSLLPGLIESVAHNRRHDTRDVRLFEVGACFSPSRGERHRLALALTGGGVPEHWAGGHRPVDFFDAKGVIERVGEALRLPLAFTTVTTPYLAPGRAAAIGVGTVAIGVVGQLIPAQSERRGLPGGDEMYVAELSLDAIGRLEPAGDIQVEPLPRFPSIVRDISIVVDEGLRAEPVRATIRRAAPSTLVSVREFDRYKGKGIPEGRYSLSLRLTFRSPDHTLTDADVQGAMGRIMEALAQEHQAIQR
ncbi:MAG TPA: phenylalanine--tRNA ligase subunit beta [Vicinamibacterales bacterium]